jgi:hypothetical protein
MEKIKSVVPVDMDRLARRRAECDKVHKHKVMGRKNWKGGKF